MAIIQAPFFLGGATESAYVIEQSLMFDGVADYLKLTPVTAGSTSKATYSFWVKRSGLGDAELDVLNCETDTSTQRDGISFGDGSTADVLSVRFNDANDGHIKTNDLMRDPTAWQHWVVAIDTGQSTAADRVKIYKNGTQITSFATASYPSQGYVMQGFMQDDKSFIGTTVNENGYYFDGYLADFIGIDGIQLAASAFGETDTNGIWIPKDPSSTDNISDWGGVNSFWLKFADATNLGFNSRPTALTANAGTYKIDNSLWLDGAADYLERTPSSQGNLKTYTLSFWAKVANKNTLNGYILDAGAAGANGEGLVFSGASSTPIYITGIEGDGYGFRTTSALYRDPSAWFHVVYVKDTANGVADDRIKIFVNGVRITDFSATRTVPLDEAGGAMNTTVTHRIGGNIYSSSPGQFYGGYLAEYIFLDGYAGTASDFGGWDVNGNWLPVDPTTVVTNNKGTNGFHLDFALAQGSGNGAGNDISGNNNDYTNYSITAAQTTTDSPTNTAADNEGNYPVWNLAHSSIDHSTSVIDSVTEGNLRATVTSNASSTIFSTMASPASGKYMIRFVNKDASNNSNILVGLQDTSQALPAYNSSAGIASSGQRSVVYRFSGGYLYINGTNSHQYTTGASADNTLDLAWDADTGKVWIAVNGTWQDGEGNTGGGSTDIAGAGTGNVATLTSGYQYAIAVSMWDTTSVFIDQDGGTLPTDFKRFNTANLPATTVTDPRKYWSNTLYTGTATDRSVRQCFDSTGTAWTPDFVWIKGRSDAGEHVLLDSVRGVTKVLTPDSTAAEFTDTKSLTSFDEGGFTLGVGDDRNDSNDNAKTYVAWSTKAGGSASSNSNGSITSSVSAASHGGFSIGTFTVNTTGAFTVGHGLSRAPAMIIVKDMDAVGGWWVWIEEYAATGKYLRLETTDATSTSGTFLSATPTSSVFATSGSWLTNGEEHVFYAFAKTPGLIGAGTYTGNGSSDGPMVIVDDGASGFRPAWVMCKRTDSTGNWPINDAARSPFNQTNSPLFADQTAADGSGINMDFIANGFKIRDSSTTFNASSGTYIYLAFADQPFNLAKAR